MKDVFFTTLKNWYAHDPFRKSASAAYYAIFSLPGLMIIIATIISLFFDRQWAEAEILSHVRDALGNDAAQNVRGIIEQSRIERANGWALMVAVPILLFGGTALFAELQASLNEIWEVEVKQEASWLSFLKKRLISLSIIMVIGVILLSSMILTAFLAAFSARLTVHFPQLNIDSTLSLNLLISFGMLCLLFTLIFKILPDVYVAWGHALRGGILAAVLFSIGQYAMTYYFNVAAPGSAFGAAGAIVLLMLWVSYSCLILFMGAEFTKAYGEWDTGRKARPTELARAQSEPTLPARKPTLKERRSRFKLRVKPSQD